MSCGAVGRCHPSKYVRLLVAAISSVDLHSLGRSLPLLACTCRRLRLSGSGLCVGVACAVTRRPVIFAVLTRCAAPSLTDCRFLLTMSMGTIGLGVPTAGGDGTTTNAEVRGRHTHEGLRPLDGAFHSPRRLFSSQALLHSLPVTGGRCFDGRRCWECTTRAKRSHCGERLRCVGGGALGLGGGRVGRSGDASLCKARRVGCVNHM